MTGLFKKRVGLFPATTSNAALLDAILTEYEIAPETIQHLMLSGADLATIVSQKGVDSVGRLRGPPWVKESERLSLTEVAPDFWRAEAHYGFMERPDVPAQGLLA